MTIGPKMLRLPAAHRWLSALLAVISLLGGCATHRLQPDTGKTRDYALPPAAAGPLYELSVKAAEGANEEESLFLPLSSNVEALKWRILLTDLARESIDIQYYLIDQDEGSRLLSQHIVRAANRGVHIRILVDDVFVGARDRNIVLWDRHPNISIRVFNPWHKRGSLVQQGLEFFGYPERLNRRMHNKAFIADNQIAIAEQRSALDQRLGALKELFGVLQMVSGQCALDVSDRDFGRRPKVPASCFQREARKES